MKANLSMMIKDALLLSDDPRKTIVVLVNNKSLIDPLIYKKLYCKRPNSVYVIGIKDSDHKDSCYKIAGVCVTDIFLYDISIDSNEWAVLFVKSRLRGGIAIHYYSENKMHKK